MSHWIKMKVDLSTNPKVVRIAAMMKADRLKTVGGLHAVWSIFDTHSANGELIGYTAEILSEMIGWKKFAETMVAVEWLLVKENSLSMKDFDENNGKSAKKRAQNAVVQGRARKDDNSHAGKVTNVTSEGTPEKEKDKNNTPIVPGGDLDLEIEGTSADSGDLSYSGDFLTFWEAYPSKKEKRAAWRAWGRMKARPSAAVMVESVRLQEIDRASARAKNEFYPEWKHPATWLTGGCWEDQLNYAAKKEKAPVVHPSNWREILVDMFPENFPDGMASANFPSSFRFIEPSVQQAIRDHAELVGEIKSAITPVAEKEAA